MCFKYIFYNFLWYLLCLLAYLSENFLSLFQSITVISYYISQETMSSSSTCTRIVHFHLSVKGLNLWQHAIFVNLCQRQGFDFVNWIRLPKRRSFGSIPSVKDQNCNGMPSDHPWSSGIAYCEALAKNINEQEIYLRLKHK